MTGRAISLGRVWQHRLPWRLRGRQRRMALCRGSITSQRRRRLQWQLPLLRRLRIRRLRGHGMAMCRRLTVDPRCQSLGVALPFLMRQQINLLRGRVTSCVIDGDVDTTKE
jgi:hypothetical protein